MKTIYFLYFKVITTMLSFALICRLCAGPTIYNYLILMGGLILYCMFSLEKGSKSVFLLFGIPIGKIFKIPKEHLFIRNKLIKRSYTRCEVKIDFAYFRVGTLACAVVDDNFYKTIGKYWKNIFIDDDMSLHIMVPKSRFISDPNWDLVYSGMSSETAEIIPLYIKGKTVISEIKLKYC